MEIHVTVSTSFTPACTTISSLTHSPPTLQHPFHKKVQMDLTQQKSAEAAIVSVFLCTMCGKFKDSESKGIRGSTLPPDLRLISHLSTPPRNLLIRLGYSMET